MCVAEARLTGVTRHLTHVWRRGWLTDVSAILAWPVCREERTWLLAHEPIRQMLVDLDDL
jgi:hypothetical protein